MPTWRQQTANAWGCRWPGAIRVYGYVLRHHSDDTATKLWVIVVISTGAVIATRVSLACDE